MLGLQKSGEIYVEKVIRGSFRTHRTQSSIYDELFLAKNR